MRRQAHNFLSLPMEACPVQASFPFVPWLMPSLERLRRNRVDGSVLRGPPSLHRGSFPILPIPVASEVSMLYATQAKKKPKKQRDRSSATMLSFTASFPFLKAKLRLEPTTDVESSSLSLSSWKSEKLPLAKIPKFQLSFFLPIFFSCNKKKPKIAETPIFIVF